MKNILRPFRDNRYKTSIHKKYNYLMEEFDPAEKMVDLVFYIYKKIYRYLEVRFIVWYERKFDAVQRKQLLVSKYLFKFMFVFCFLFYTGSLLVWDYNARTQTLLIPTVKAKEQVKITEEVKPDYSIVELVDYIHMQETGRGNAESGLHITCRNKGMTNEYGYRAMDAWSNGVFNSDNAFCFENTVEEVLTVTELITKLVNKYGIYEAMCIYNTGSTKNGNCDYVEILKTWRAN